MVVLETDDLQFEFSCYTNPDTCWIGGGAALSRLLMNPVKRSKGQGDSFSEPSSFSSSDVTFFDAPSPLRNKHSVDLVDPIAIGKTGGNDNQKDEDDGCRWVEHEGRIVKACTHM